MRGGRKDRKAGENLGRPFDFIDEFSTQVEGTRRGRRLNSSDDAGRFKHNLFGAFVKTSESLNFAQSRYRIFNSMHWDEVGIYWV